MTAAFQVLSNLGLEWIRTFSKAQGLSGRHDHSNCTAQPRNAPAGGRAAGCSCTFTINKANARLP